jgi:hypothetical protein
MAAGRRLGAAARPAPDETEREGRLVARNRRFQSCNDVTQLLPLVDVIPFVPSVRGHVRRPRRRPDCLIATVATTTTATAVSCSGAADPEVVHQENLAVRTRYASSRGYHVGFRSDNKSSRTHPARGRLKLPPAPAHPRKLPDEKPCSFGESPPIPAHPGTTMTGLSRRRSRVRVPSLPLLTPRFTGTTTLLRRAEGSRSLHRLCRALPSV